MYQESVWEPSAHASGAIMRKGRLISRIESNPTLTRRRAIGATLSAAHGGLLAACADHVRPIRIAISAFPTYELLYLAQELGFYSDEGVSVEIVELSGLSDVRDVLANGQVDGAATTTADLLITAAASRVELQIVWALDVSAGADMILAQTSIANVAALRGKRVGLEFDSVGVSLLGHALKSAGLSFTDITAVDIAQDDADALIATRQIDALVTYPPAANRLRAVENWQAIFDSSLTHDQILDVLVFRREIVDRRADDVRGILRAYQHAIAFFRENPRDAAALMAKREHVTAEAFTQSLDSGLILLNYGDQTRFFGSEGILIQNLLSSLDFQRSLGVVTGNSIECKNFLPEWRRIDPAQLS